MTEKRAPFELYILEGEQAGARAPIRPDSSILIGSDPDGDIVLRDPQLKGERLRLEMKTDSAQVEVLAGTIRIQGKEFTEGHRIELQPSMPLTIGCTTLAYEMVAVGADESEPACGEGVAPEEIPTVADEVRTADRQGEEVRRTLGKNLLDQPFLPVLLLVAAMLAATGIYRIVSESFAQSRQEVTETGVARMLSLAGFTGLAVDRNEAGEFVVQGYLESTAQRERLEQTLAGWAIHPPVQIKIQTGEELAATVQDLYRVNGIKAEVKPDGAGVVRVITEESDADKLERVAALAREDVAGLREIVTINHEPEKVPEPTLVRNDPGKRVAAVVPGDPAYIVTVDGARYFVGSMMPSGHKIFAILDQRVLLDKDGTVVALEF